MKLWTQVTEKAVNGASETLPALREHLDVVIVTYSLKWAQLVPIATFSDFRGAVMLISHPNLYE